MKLTNKHNLPQAMYRAIANDPYTFTGNISVTQLIQPPRIRQLKIRHETELEEDITDKLWTLMGSAVHYVLERAEEKQAPDLQEIRIEKDFGEWKVSGQADLWESPDSLYDYKFTSVWAVIGEPKKDWVEQLNMLAHLYRYAGFEINNLYIMAILRDWSKNRARQGGDYPRIGAKKVIIPLMPDKDVEALIMERILLHKKAESLEDTRLPLCTEEERWSRKDQFAIMKNENKRATKLCDSKEEAEKYLSNLTSKDTLKNKYSIILRKGENIRCENYCIVKDFCNQYKTLKGEGNG